MIESRSPTSGHTSSRKHSPRGMTIDVTLDADNPFPGPKPYRRDQKELFFGRSSEIEELTSLVLSTSAVLLYAQSGSGKSSLLQAGLVPSLEVFGYRILPAVRFGRVDPMPDDSGADTSQPNPFAKMVCDTVIPGDTLPPDGLDLGQLAAFLRDEDGGTPTLLILDQFEELFANQALWQERGAFLAQLRRVLDANPWLHTVLAIRSDYLANLLPHERDLPGRMLIRCGLESLREQAAREAIEMTFRKTGVPLSSSEMDLVLDRLLSLDVGLPGSHVRGQYVNLIQLQILCRRLWREKAAPRSRNEAGASDDSQVLQQSDVDLADYMQSFVDDAVASAVTQTQSDEGVVRRWLEDRLTTPASRRAVLLVDNEQTAGLPQEILDALENARLIQVEQRNQSQWAELTHDSMVAAVQASNKEWGRIRRRTRRLRTAALALALAGLMVLFPFLRFPTDQNLLTKATGVLTVAPLEIGTLKVPFPAAPRGSVAVVHVSLYGESDAGTTVQVFARSPGKKQATELASRTVTVVANGAIDTTLNFVINTRQQASYAAIVKAPNLQSDIDAKHLGYNVTVRSAPVVLDLRKPGTSVLASVRSPLVAVKLYPHKPLYLGIIGPDLQDVWGVRTLITDPADDAVVLESSGGTRYAVLSTSGSADEVVSPEVYGQLVKLGPTLQLGAHAHIQSNNVSIRSLHIEQRNVPFGVETSCKDDDVGTSKVIDSAEQSVGSIVRSVPDGSAFVPAAHGSEYRLILLANNFSTLDCQVTVRSFAQQGITTTTNGSIKVNANSRFNAYRVRIPTAAVMVVANLNGARASLDCLSNQITESGPERLLAFVPGDHECVLSIARYSGNIRKPVSFPLLIDPVSGK